MKKLIGAIATVLLLGGMTSCGSGFDAEDDGNYRLHRTKEKPVMKTLRLQFGGDYVSETEEPLLRAEDGETFVGLNVFRTKKDEADAKEEKYAYGMFVGKDGISISVLTGYTYRFEATILIEHEDHLYSTTNRQYCDPFRVFDQGSVGFDGVPFEQKYLDDFIYTVGEEDESHKKYLPQLNKGIAHVNTNGDLKDTFGNAYPGYAMNHPRVKRFYGRNDSFDPALLDTIEIPMDYKSFGLKFILESIPAGTSVTVEDNTSQSVGKDHENNPELYLLFPSNLKLDKEENGVSEWEGIYSLYSFSQDTKDIRLRFTWNKGNGETEKFNHSFTLTAKKKKVLKLNIDGDVNETKSGNIIFTQMDDTLEEEDPDVIDKNYK